jgi:Tfp pilus assembly protein PilX
MKSGENKSREYALTRAKKPEAISSQQGVVLFFTLIALVVMSLAALALVRSVDTGSMIAGNLAFKQAATTAAEAGVEAAINYLDGVQQANLAKNVFTDPTHSFNNDNPAEGYYSSLDPKLSLTVAGGLKWIDWTNDLDNKFVGVDKGDNSVRYVIQRLCMNPNVIATNAKCLYTADAKVTGSKAVPLPSEICNSVDCPLFGESPQYIVTVRVAGPRGTVSYVQNFVY